MQSSATTVDEYLEKIGSEKAAVLFPLIEDVRSVIDDGFEEAMNWGMVSYQVPLSICPKTYNKKPLLYCSLAAQKRHFAIYLMGAYSDSIAHQKIVERYDCLGLKLDMGKCCLRFKNLSGIDREVVKEVVGLYDVDSWIEHYKSCRNRT